MGSVTGHPRLSDPGWYRLTEAFWTFYSRASDPEAQRKPVFIQQVLTTVSTLLLLNQHGLKLSPEEKQDPEIQTALRAVNLAELLD
ncbi:hypothetical protein D7Y13_04415 [Corallococcus praedator]|uniref:Uncharacterized protein n=1 Tax=Corallococcus praedator TaxID=2316724 RepID=A0ABX9QQD2_9BACT|nr:hypothetical protein D7X74_01215 [Corallococcus sp. CA047B]RKH35783.1 hypothetical protein D7X75_03255 [Corallococcus sp. CA031C]RKI15430.1 hypothetical protein D7Y13_04415 [Corallococcus praedator]